MYVVSVLHVTESFIILVRMLGVRKACAWRRVWQHVFDRARMRARFQDLLGVHNITTYTHLQPNCQLPHPRAVWDGIHLCHCTLASRCRASGSCQHSLLRPSDCRLQQSIRARRVRTTVHRHTFLLSRPLSRCLFGRHQLRARVNRHFHPRYASTMYGGVSHDSNQKLFS